MLTELFRSQTGGKELNLWFQKENATNGRVRGMKGELHSYAIMNNTILQIQEVKTLNTNHHDRLKNSETDKFQIPRNISCMNPSCSYRSRSYETIASDHFNNTKKKACFGDYKTCSTIQGEKKKLVNLSLGKQITENKKEQKVLDKIHDFIRDEVFSPAKSIEEQSFRDVCVVFLFLLWRVYHLVREVDRQSQKSDIFDSLSLEVECYMRMILHRDRKEDIENTAYFKRYNANYVAHNLRDTLYDDLRDFVLISC